MRVLEVHIEHLSGVDDGPYSFGDGETPHGVVVLEDPGALLLQTTAALLEAERGPSRSGMDAAWWTARRGAVDVKLRARWALSEAEALRVGTTDRSFVSEWALGVADELPRALNAVGAPSADVRRSLVQYVYIDVARIQVVASWDTDPLAELLSRIAREDIAATGPGGEAGAGGVDKVAAVSRAVAALYPSLKLKRVACAPGGTPVAWFRGGRRVALDQLHEQERAGIYVAGEAVAATVSDGVILVDRFERQIPPGDHVRWLRWLESLVGTNQIIVATTSEALLEPQPGAS